MADLMHYIYFIYLLVLNVLQKTKEFSGCFKLTPRGKKQLSQRELILKDTQELKI